jgi:hypothetical protein
MSGILDLLIMWFDTAKQLLDVLSGLAPGMYTVDLVSACLLSQHNLYSCSFSVLPAIPPFLSSWKDWIWISEKLNKSKQNCKKKKKTKSGCTYYRQRLVMKKRRCIRTADLSTGDSSDESETSVEMVATNEDKPSGTSCFWKFFVLLHLLFLYCGLFCSSKCYQIRG